MIPRVCLLLVVAGLGQRVVPELLQGLDGRRRGVDRGLALLAVVGALAQVQDLALAGEILIIQLLLAHPIGKFGNLPPQKVRASIGLRTTDSKPCNRL